jgi:uncharacterized membrane protein
VIDVESGVSADAFDAQLNALDMLAVGAQVARGDAAVVLNPLGVTIPGSRRATAQLADRPGAAPRVRSSRAQQRGRWNTTVRTGQVRMAITLALGNLACSEPSRVAQAVRRGGADRGAPRRDRLRRCVGSGSPVVIDAEPGLVRLGIGEYPDFNTSPIRWRPIS